MEIIPITPQPPQQSAAPETTSPGKDDTGFNQLFTEKVSEKQQQKSPDQEQTAGREAAPEKKALPTNAEEQQSPQTAESGQSGESTAPPVPAATDSKPAGAAPSSDSRQQQAVRYQSISLSTTVTAEFSSQSSNMDARRFQFSSLEELASITNRLFSSPHARAAESSGGGSDTNPITLRLTVEQSGRAHHAAPLTAQNSLLLQEIQKLVNQNNDSLSMRGHFSHNHGSRGFPGFLDGPMNGTLTTGTEGGNATLSVALQDGPIPALKIPLNLQQDANAQRQPTLRQEAAEQLLNARLADTTADKGDQKNGATSDNARQNNTSGQQQAAAGQQGLPNPAPGIPEPASGMQSFASHFNTPSTTPGIDSGTPQPLQTSMQQQYIQENEVISQIVNRFQLHTKLQSGRMTLQLHPAELGKLKIDVEMKGDSLKANIVAQTQQAQEIIERNLPRLRGILQQQGLTVEDVLVTFESDIIDDFSGQQNSFFREQTADFQNHGGKNLKQTSFAGIIDESLDEDAPLHHGVNLTA